MCGADRVRQACHSVPGLRLEVQRPAPVECELKGDREPPRWKVLMGGDRSRQRTQLSMAAKNRLATQWRLHGSMTHRPTGVGDCSVESEGDALADSRLFEVIRS